MRRIALAACLVVGLAACAVSGRPAQIFVVFFKEWSAELDGPAKGVIQTAADWAKAHPNAPVTVAGYADPEGSLQANIDISKTRAQRVFDELAADGVPAGRIARTALGPVDYTLSSQESRRVEIRIGRD